MWAFAWEKEKSEKEDDRLYRHFTGVKFHLKSYFLFNLNKTLNCLAAHLVSLNSCFLSFSLAPLHTLSFMCTDNRVQSGCCVCVFLYCTHISFWPTFFKLPMGFCMARGTTTFIYETEGKETEVRDLFMFLLIFVASTPSRCCSFSHCVALLHIYLSLLMRSACFSPSMPYKAGLIAVRTHRRGKNYTGEQNPQTIKIKAKEGNSKPQVFFFLWNN